MQRLRSRGTSLLGSLKVHQVKKKAVNSWAAVQDTYFSTKDTFERHKVVFTVGTSIASVATAWIGYSLRHYHERKVSQRLESIEKALKNNHDLEHDDLKKLVGTGGSTFAAWFATAGTAFVVGYGFGWRGGRWYANRKFRREQMKLLGQLKPRKWQLLGKMKYPKLQLKFLRRLSARNQVSESAAKTAEKVKPLAAEKVKPLAAEKVEPLPAEKVKPLTAEKVEPLTTKKVEPLEAKKVEPLTAEKMEPLAAEKVEPLTADKAEPLRANQSC